MQFEHHKRQELCTTRSRYREGRRLTAIKVYTVSQESRYLLVQGVPAVGGQHDLLKMFSQFGVVDEYRVLDEIAKRKLDDRSFFGGVLHICYAPEYETIDDTRQKLMQRRFAVLKRIKELEKEKEAKTASKAAKLDEIDRLLSIEGSQTSVDQTVSQGSLSTPPEHLAIMAGGCEPLSLPAPHLLPSSVPLVDGISFALPPPPHAMMRHYAVPYQYPLQVPPQQLMHRPLPPNATVPPLPPFAIPPFRFQRHPPAVRLSSSIRESLPTSNVTELLAGSNDFSTNRSGNKRDFDLTMQQHRLQNGKLNAAGRVPNVTSKTANVPDTSSNQQLIVRSLEFKPTSSKLVRRQVSTHKQISANLLGLIEADARIKRIETRQRISDSINAALKTNALKLGDEQGPRTYPTEKKSELKQLTDNVTGKEQKEAEKNSLTGDSSQDATLANIRKRVMQFSAQALPPQLLKKKKSSN